MRYSAVMICVLIMPGSGYPIGWQHPQIIFSHCRSLLIGAWFAEPPSAPEAPSWGAVKAIFAR